MCRVLWILFFSAVGTLVWGEPEVTIGMVVEGEEQVEHPYYEVVVGEIRHLLQEEWEVHFKEFSANWSEAGAKRAADRAFADPKVDIVVTIGHLGSLAVLQREQITKPTVVFSVAESLLKGNVPNHQDNPLVVTIESSQPLGRDLEDFREIVPIQTLAVIGDASLFDQKGIKKTLLKTLEEKDIQGKIFPVTNHATFILKQIEEMQPDGVFFLPIWRLEPNELIAGINSLHIPSYTVMGEAMVDQGVLATSSPFSNVRKVGRRLALNIQDLLLYGKDHLIEPYFPMNRELILNDTVVEQLHLSLSWNVLNSARFIHPRPIDRTQEINLLNSVFTALQANLDLDVQRYGVVAGEENIRRARSSLLPQVVAAGTVEAIDADRARFANGRQPQFSAIAGMALNQSVYEERLHADYDIQTFLQRAREKDLASFELDRMLDTSIAYISVLRQLALEEIERQNLQLTKGNLKFAQDRVNSGEARRSEVYRWESEIARNKQSLLIIRADRKVAETNFNRLLNRPLDTNVMLIPLDRHDFSVYQKILDEYIQTPRDQCLWTEYLLQQTEKNSPEIVSLSWQIEARDRAHIAAKRANWLPDIRASGEISERFWRDGAGRRFPSEVKADHFDATAILDITYPLWTSGKRDADVRQSYAELKQTQFDQGATIERLDKRTRDAVERVMASYGEIFLSKKASEAAEKNLLIVQDTYARGVSSIIDLIDAQNNVLRSKREQANTLYDHFEDLMRLQRAIALFEFCLDSDEKGHFLNQFSNYLNYYRECVS